MSEPTSYREMLSKVDPGRLHGDLPVGLRDGALLALLSAGVGFAEASRLDFTAFAIEGTSNRLRVTLQRDSPWTCSRILDSILSARVLAWISEARGWNEARPVFTNSRGIRISARALGQIVKRYANGGRG